MSDSLAIPSNPAELYDARGADIPLSRPLMQGDVLKNVDIPGLATDTGLAMVIMHPCSMRTGSTLRKRLTVVRLIKHHALQLTQWPDGDYDFMPLPDLMGDNVDDPAVASCFRDVGSVKTTDLDLRSRIAILSARGILYLQQRYVHSGTRVVVDLETLSMQMSPIFDELELQEEWVDAALAARVSEPSFDEIKAIQVAEREFQDFLSVDNDYLRRGLKDPMRRTEVRRTIRLEVRRRDLQA
ncbi:hypothetical protein [Ferrimicrobium sp.]|uniref:hypothetical protein n=1 Tax=Ferrimicrobium sp. TaxID=2926050 RepID=UPI0026192B56|nr:hypothetical protein [Ferrimicrobium sp.]